MRPRILLLSMLVAMSLGACSAVDSLPERLGLPERGFLTHALDEDSSAGVDAPVTANTCTEAGCPQAPAFCAARGYAPGGDGYQRCLFSVEQNLRRTP